MAYVTALHSPRNLEGSQIFLKHVKPGYVRKIKICVGSTGNRAGLQKKSEKQDLCTDFERKYTPSIELKKMQTNVTKIHHFSTLEPYLRLTGFCMTSRFCKK